MKRLNKIVKRDWLLELVRVDEAARICGVHPQTIRRRIKDGTLEAFRFGPRMLRVRRYVALGLPSPE